jgi:RimJ/RimL family protein N-acetyltransferase
MERSSKVVLRPLSPADVESIKQWPRYSGEFVLLDYALRSGGWLDTFQESATTIRFGGWLHGELVGFSLLTEISAESAEFYIAIHPAQTGRGIGRKITTEILKYAFANLKVRRVYLKVRKWHSRGIALYERVGFVITGDKIENIQGEPVDFFLMEIHNLTKSSS